MPEAPRRFLTFDMGDNDFGHCFFRMVQYLWLEYPERLESAELPLLREMAVAIVRGYATARSGEDPGEYIAQHLTVSETEKDKDADHGACSIDLSTGYIWQH